MNIFRRFIGFANLFFKKPKSEVKIRRWSQSPIDSMEEHSRFKKNISKVPADYHFEFLEQRFNEFRKHFPIDMTLEELAYLLTIVDQKKKDWDKGYEIINKEDKQ